jgi:Na+/H+-dicarboxylate symporter
MNTKRVLIAAIIGLICGLFCAHRTMMMAKKGEATFPVTAGILASIVYNRLLIGLVVGIVDNIRLHSVLRGGLIGTIITMAWSMELLQMVGQQDFQKPEKANKNGQRKEKFSCLLWALL